MSKKQKKYKRFIKKLEPILLKIAPSIISTYSFCVGKTSTLEIRGNKYIQNRNDIFSWKKSVIYCVWHSRFFYFSYFGRGKDIITMISPSRDGEIITRTIEKLKLYAIRGSSSKKGLQAFNYLNKLLKNGYKVLVIPDGPKGPRYKIKMGVIKLSQLSGKPIIPICYSSTKGIFLPSWDHFFIPFPFGKIVVTVGEPLYIPSNCTQKDLNIFKEILENRMNKIRILADSLCKRDPEKEILKFKKKNK